MTTVTRGVSVLVLMLEPYPATSAVMISVAFCLIRGSVDSMTVTGAFVIEEMPFATTSLRWMVDTSTDLSIFETL